MIRYIVKTFDGRYFCDKVRGWVPSLEEATFFDSKSAIDDVLRINEDEMRVVEITFVSLGNGKSRMVLSKWLPILEYLY